MMLYRSSSPSMNSRSVCFASVRNSVGKGPLLSGEAGPQTHKPTWDDWSGALRR